MGYKNGRLYCAIAVFVAVLLPSGCSRHGEHSNSGLSPVEAALVDALAARFVVSETVDRAKLNQSYASAMRRVYDAFPDVAMEGRAKETLEASKKVATKHDHNEVQDPKFGFPQLLRSIPYFSQVRFARWDDILAEKDPGSDLPFVQAMWRFARGMALAAQQDAAGAEKELASLRDITRNPALEQWKIMDVNSLAELTSIAIAFLESEVASARKRPADAVKALEKAVALEDALKYSEPPDWAIPPRHYLGAALLKARRAQGKSDEADEAGPVSPRRGPVPTCAWMDRGCSRARHCMIGPGGTSSNP